MSKDFAQLTKELQQFNYTVVLIKRTLNNDCKIQLYSQRTIVSRSSTGLKRCNELAVDIRDKFKSGKFQSGQTLRVEKLQRDFRTLLTTFSTLIEKYERSKEKELDQERQSYRQSFSAPKSKQANKRGKAHMDDTHRTIDHEDQEEGGQRIEMVQVNQDMLLQGQMIEQKAKELLNIKNQMENVLNIQQEIAGLINTQGKQLDIAEDNIDDANKNVKEAVQNLKDAKEHHKSASKKKMVIIGIILVVVLAIVIPVAIKLT